MPCIVLSDYYVNKFRRLLKISLLVESDARQATEKAREEYEETFDELQESFDAAMAYLATAHPETHRRLLEQFNREDDETV